MYHFMLKKMSILSTCKTLYVILLKKKFPDVYLLLAYLRQKAQDNFYDQNLSTVVKLCISIFFSKNAEQISGSVGGQIPFFWLVRAFLVLD